MPNQAPMDILSVGVTSASGNSIEAVLAALEGSTAPGPAPLRFPGKEEVGEVEGFGCDLSQARNILDPMKIRRWGRLQIMSLLAAKKASLPEILNGSESQSGVYVGTGLGSMGETSIFLENLFLQNENFPKPSHFVNSVHNAAASTLGLEFGLEGENITVVHREISFDAALGHGLSALRQGRLKYAVVCGADEMNYFQVRAGLAQGIWKPKGRSFKPLDEKKSKGTYPGEGAAVCVLAAAGTSGAKPLGRILGVRASRYKRDARTYVHLPRAGDFLEGLCASAGIGASEIDLMLLGANGDSRLDALYRRVGHEFTARAGKPVAQAAFKQLCGEYRAASAFGFALAVSLLRSGKIPPGLLAKTSPLPTGPVKTILLYQLSRSGDHSACLVRAS